MMYEIYHDALPEKVFDFIGVLRYVFFNGFASSHIHGIVCIFFEGLAFVFVIAAATSLAVLASSNGNAELPVQIANFIPEGQAAKYGVIGLISALLAGAICKFFASIALNSSLPKVESYFYNSGIKKFARLDVAGISALDFDIDKYLYRDLLINTRFTMMVFRFWMMAFVPLSTLLVLIPILAYVNWKITVAMLCVLILFMPVYYVINKRSNNITQEMDVASRNVSAVRRATADGVLKSDFDIDQRESLIAPSLADNNKDVWKFFHLFGERFTMIEATSLTNTLVLFLVVGALAMLTMQEGINGMTKLNVTEFVVVLVVLRQVHTAVSRGLMVINTMSRFYTRLFDLKRADQVITNVLNRDVNSNSKSGKIEDDSAPIETLTYKHIDTERSLPLSVSTGNVHLVFDNQPPSRLSLIGIKPGTDVHAFAQFIQTRDIDTMHKSDPEFSFASYRESQRDIDKVIHMHHDLLSELYDESELRRVPETPMTFDEIMCSTLGDGISYLRPRTIKIYACIIDLKQKLQATKNDVVFLDARALMHLQPSYTEKAIGMMQTLDKTIFIVLSKQNYANAGFNAERAVIIKGRTKADGYVEYGRLASIVDKLCAPAAHTIDNDMDIV